MKLLFSVNPLNLVLVKRIFIIFLFCAVLLGFTDVHSAAATGGMTKVQVTHSHEGSDHHHGHSHSDLHIDDQKDSGEDEGSSGESEGSSHTHEIALCAGFCCFLAQPLPEFDFQPVPELNGELLEVFPPQSPSLGTIFRPPIA